MICPKGSNCWLGNTDPLTCPFGDGACPDKGSSYPGMNIFLREYLEKSYLFMFIVVLFLRSTDPAPLFFLLLAIFVVYIIIHKYTTKKILFRKELHINKLTNREMKIKGLG